MFADGQELVGKVVEIGEKPVYEAGADVLWKVCKIRLSNNEIVAVGINSVVACIKDGNFKRTPVVGDDVRGVWRSWPFYQGSYDFMKDEATGSLTYIRDAYQDVLEKQRQVTRRRADFRIVAANG